MTAGKVIKAIDMAVLNAEGRANRNAPNRNVEEISYGVASKLLQDIIIAIEEGE